MSVVDKCYGGREEGGREGQNVTSGKNKGKVKRVVSFCGCDVGEQRTGEILRIGWERG